MTVTCRHLVALDGNDTFPLDNNVHVNLLQSRSWCSFSTAPPALLLIIPVIVLYAHCSLLALLKPLVFAVGPKPILYHHGSVSHLFKIRVLLITPIIILNDYSCCSFLILLLLLTSFVRSVSFLDYFRSFVQLTLLSIY